MIKEQIITKIDEIQNTLAKLVVMDFFMTEGGAWSRKLKETKSYGKRRKKYKPKGDITAAARELASPEGIDIAKAKAYVGYARMESGVESRVMKLMNQHEAGKIDLGQLEWGLKKEFGIAYKEAYVFGQNSVGFSGDLMNEDLAFIKSFKRTENKFLGKFMKAIAAEKLVMDRYERLKMYVETIRTVFDHARVEASPDWVNIYWTPSRGARHCPDCLILAINSPYTKKTLPTTPRAGDTRCLCITTPNSRILTKRGWIAIADVKEGDLVFTHRARWKKVLKAHRNRPDKSHVQAWIKAPTGERVGVTADHHFLSYNRHNGWCWESLDNINELKSPMLMMKNYCLPGLYSKEDLLYNDHCFADFITIGKIEISDLIINVLPEAILYDLSVEDDQSFIVEGLVAHNSNCKCSLMIRYKKPDDTEPIPEGIKPPGEEYELQPDLYGKFKGDVPEFRFFLDKNTGNPIAARKEFVAAVKKAKVGFTPSNYDDPYNRKFFKSNKIWFDTQKIREIEKTVTSMSPEGIALRKKRQDLMKDLLKANTELNKKGFRWIRPDGYGGYTVGADGKPFTLMPKD